MSEMRMVLQVVDIERRIQLQSEKQKVLHPGAHLSSYYPHENGVKNILSKFSRVFKPNKSHDISRRSSQPVSLF
jgi:hypothetical protein